MFGSRQGILGRDRVLVWLCVATGIPVSRHGSQILSNRTCCNIAFFVVTGVLILCRDNVATEVFLSQPRQPRQEVRCRDRVWPWARNFMSQQSIFVTPQKYPRIFIIILLYILGMN